MSFCAKCGSGPLELNAHEVCLYCERDALRAELLKYQTHLTKTEEQLTQVRAELAAAKHELEEAETMMCDAREERDYLAAELAATKADLEACRLVGVSVQAREGGGGSAVTNVRALAAEGREERMRAALVGLVDAAMARVAELDASRDAMRAALIYVRGRIDCAHPDIQRSCEAIDAALVKGAGR